MNLPGTAGESSCKRQENGVAVEPDRPLKKARFAWEVKGKYHLKNENSEGKPTVTVNEIDRPGSSVNHERESNLVGTTEQNLEILGDYLLKKDFNTLDSITDSDPSLLPSTSISSDRISYPRYISSYENSSRSESNSSTNMSIPKSMVYSNKAIEDQCIARWQARQMAKCFIDNTINCVLDSWMIAPLPTDIDNNRVLALDAAEFINNLPGDNSIENEAILMAISAHGLQNNSSTNSNDSNNLSMCDTSKDLFLSPSSSPVPSDDDNPESSDTVNQKQIDESSSNEADRAPWTFKDMQQNSNNLPLSFYQEISSSSYQCTSETDNINNNNNAEYDADDNANSNDNDIMNNHYDFLDAAVSFAIQYKGLTSYGTDYG